MNRVIDCRSEEKQQKKLFTAMRTGATSSFVLFINRFADGKTSHGRIGYAGRILSKSIGSQDEESYHHAPYVPQTRLSSASCSLFLRRPRRCVTARLIEDDNGIILLPSRHCQLLHQTHELRHSFTHPRSSETFLSSASALILIES